MCNFISGLGCISIAFVHKISLELHSIADLQHSPKQVDEDIKWVPTAYSIILESPSIPNSFEKTLFTTLFEIKYSLLLLI